jgi:hypothetical protein
MILFMQAPKCHCVLGCLVPILDCFLVILAGMVPESALLVYMPHNLTLVSVHQEKALGYTVCYRQA